MRKGRSVGEVETFPGMAGPTTCIEMPDVSLKSAPMTERGCRDDVCVDGVGMSDASLLKKAILNVWFPAMLSGIAVWLSCLAGTLEPAFACLPACLPVQASKR